MYIADEELNAPYSRMIDLRSIQVPRTTQVTVSRSYCRSNLVGPTRYMVCYHMVLEDVVPSDPTRSYLVVVGCCRSNVV